MFFTLAETGVAMSLSVVLGPFSWNLFCGLGVFGKHFQELGTSGIFNLASVWFESGCRGGCGDWVCAVIWVTWTSSLSETLARPMENEGLVNAGDINSVGMWQTPLMSFGAVRVHGQ